MNYNNLRQLLVDARYTVAALPPPMPAQRTDCLMQLANLTVQVSSWANTPNPTPEDCAELRRLADAIQQILKYCPIVNPVPES